VSLRRKGNKGAEQPTVLIRQGTGCPTEYLTSWLTQGAMPAGLKLTRKPNKTPVDEEGNEKVQWLETGLPDLIPNQLIGPVPESHVARLGGNKGADQAQGRKKTSLMHLLAILLFQNFLLIQNTDQSEFLLSGSRVQLPGRQRGSRSRASSTQRETKSSKRLRSGWSPLGTQTRRTSWCRGQRS
jgi:hypothetical protein